MHRVTYPYVISSQARRRLGLGLTHGCQGCRLRWREEHLNSDRTCDQQLEETGCPKKLQMPGSGTISHAMHAWQDERALRLPGV